MKQIIIGKDITYAAKVGGSTISDIKDIGSLDTGAVAIFTEKGVLITTSNKGTVLDDCKKIFIAVGNQVDSSKTIITVPIPRRGVYYSKKEYKAPVKCRKFIGSNGSSGALNMPTVAAGTEAFIRITNTTAGLRVMGAVTEQEVFRYSYYVLSGDTNATVITAIIAKINADPDRIVNATDTGSQAGIQLDAIDYGTTFSISLDGILNGATKTEQEGSTTTNSLAADFGSGTAEQVAALELAYSVERGNTSQLWLASKYWKATSLVVAGAAYDFYTISWDGVKTMELGAQNTYHQDVVVALPDVGTATSAFETIMIEVFSGYIAGTPTEMGS